MDNRLRLPVFAAACSAALLVPGMLIYTTYFRCYPAERYLCSSPCGQKLMGDKSGIFLEDAFTAARRYAEQHQLAEPVKHGATIGPEGYFFAIRMDKDRIRRWGYEVSPDGSVQYVESNACYLVGANERVYLVTEH